MSAENRPFVDAIFRAWSAFYDNPVQQKLYFGPIQDIVVKKLGTSPGRVLDLGCGTGELIVKMGSKGVPPFGMDLSREMLLKAAAKPGLEGRLAVADGHLLPLQDASVDAVTCLVSFQYYLRPLAALREMRRVLRPGGRLLLAALTSVVFESPLVDKAMRARTEGFLRIYPPSELKRLCLDAGFGTVHYRLVRPFTRLFEATA